MTSNEEMYEALTALSNVCQRIECSDCPFYNKIEESQNVCILGDKLRPFRWTFVNISLPFYKLSEVCNDR